MITGSKPDDGTTEPIKAPAPSQDAIVDDSNSPEVKAAATSLPSKNLTLAEGKARTQAAKAASSKRADEGAAAAKKRASPGSPTSAPSIAKGFRSLYDSESDEAEVERPVTEPKRSQTISMSSRSAIKLLNCKALLRLSRRCILTDTTHRMRHLKAPRGLNHGRTSSGAYERALVQDEPHFVNDTEAARCVLLAPHRLPLKEFTSLRKKPEDRGGLFPVTGYPRIQHEDPISG
ncbi:Hypothetical protein PHPALM_12024 [Phytophthora palmivora]|uniref:ATP-binding cassette (ABC) Superfamily n=1 Tax=Phytophthora palmivora TaxID=4796 RepID=A0A2P4Y0S7_9STRA|nr:Hypothetical protein PHPALM_12024 [Phytophthora palmivora]